jgi:hypothetical protein
MFFRVYNCCTVHADHAFGLGLLLHALRRAHCILTTMTSHAASGADPNSIPLDSRVL